MGRDVLSVPDLRRVLLLEGTNGIGGGSNAPPAPANQVIDAIKLIIRRVHARMAIVGATILPMCNAAGSSREQVRTAVNNWIRTSGAFDAVLDFGPVLRDPTNPTR